ncbi:hypothetical protein DSL92_06110 [Billgrantia gudaonensis]|uniref:Uncharacterized protein n=1 Tax=Billgrantia gudaonensis TaxID=376427 RepID=A0A432JIQ2_9GAMM|nr:hypothetical protein DSL92_06110 [Halomonas gudaonensis]
MLSVITNSTGNQRHLRGRRQHHRDALSSGEDGDGATNLTTTTPTSAEPLSPPVTVWIFVTGGGASPDSQHGCR